MIPSAVAKAAIKSGVARKKIKDFDSYKDELTNRLDPSMSIMQGINSKVRKNPKRVIFAEGEDESMLKAAIEFGKNWLNFFIINGKKWWTSGAMDPRCKVLIFMGKTDPNNSDKHKQQSQIIVPMDSKGITVDRFLPVFG